MNTKSFFDAKRSPAAYCSQAAVIAAVYACTTFIAAAAGISYGPIQFRFSEALTVLALFTPAAVPGLTIGCLLGNLASPYGIADILLGTLATLLAAVATRATRRIMPLGIPVLAPVFSTLFNSVLIGLEIALFLPDGVSWAGFALSAFQVGAGELAVCCLLGLPLYYIIKKGDKFPHEENSKF